MAGYDGNGNFFFTYSWVNDAANGIPITAPRMDGQFNDAVGGFDLCVTRDGQGKMGTSFLPDTDASYNIGSALLRWTNGYYSGAVSIAGALAAGAATFSGTVMAQSSLLSVGSVTGGGFIDFYKDATPTFVGGIGAYDQVAVAPFSGLWFGYYDGSWHQLGIWTGARFQSKTVISTTVYTVSTLPAGANGDRAFVSDATSLTFGALPVGGGTTNAPVFYDGSSWKIG